MIPQSTESEQTYETPQWFFDQLRERWPFTLDAAASAGNAKCAAFYDEAANGLLQPWAPVTFCNPPYMRADRWVRKAFLEVRDRGVTAVLLLRARMETRYFREYQRFAEIEVITPRVPFKHPDKKKKSPPHGSMLMIFTPWSVANLSPPDVVRCRIVEYRRPKAARVPRKVAA